MFRFNADYSSYDQPVRWRTSGDDWEWPGFWLIWVVMGVIRIGDD
jgi:hypothetical protein